MWNEGDDTCGIYSSEFERERENDINSAIRFFLHFVKKVINDNSQIKVSEYKV